MNILFELGTILTQYNQGFGLRQGWVKGPGMGEGQTLNLDSALSQLYETVAAILTNAKMYLNCTSEIKLLFFEEICEKLAKTAKIAKIVKNEVSRASQNFRL